MAKSPVIPECYGKVSAFLVGYDGPDPLKTLSTNRDKVKTELGPAIISAHGDIVHCVRIWLDKQPGIVVTTAMYERDVDKTYKIFRKLDECSPGVVPKPYDYSSQQKLLFFEDLKNSEIMQQQFDRCHVEKMALQQLGEHIAALHAATHVNKLDQTQFSQLQNDFGTADNGQPFENEDTYPILTDIRTKKECLVHGSLQPNCIIIKNYAPKVVAVEGVHAGACATDPACVLAHLILDYHRHMLTPEDNDRHRQVSYKLVEAAKLFGDRYFERLCEALQTEPQHTLALISEVAALCGALLLKIASTGQYNHPQGLQDEVKQSAQRLLRGHQRIDSTDRLLVIALMLTY